MKLLKYSLISSLLLILLGILGKSLLSFPFAGFLFFLGLAIYILGGAIYGIINLSKGKDEITATMVILSLPSVLGILLKTQHWPGGSFVFVIGTFILMAGSGLIFTQALSKKKDLVQSVLFLSVGWSGLFFLFKIMRWPGALVMFIPGAIGIGTSIVLILIKRPKIDLSKIACLIVLSLIIVTFTTNPSQIYRFQNIYKFDNQMNFPENYHKYAWMLYQEGNQAEAKLNLDLAIQQANNPNNFRIELLQDGPELATLRYQRALASLQEKNWSELELPLDPSW